MPRDYRFYVYIMTNKRNSVFYTGITNNLRRRVFEHKAKIVKGFTEKYKVVKLLYFEVFSNVKQAIRREKQVKDFARKRKLELIKKMNPLFKDLSDEWWQ